MDEILEDLPGVVGITDDVCVHGKDEEEHDRNLKELMDRAKETGLVFNSDKCTIRPSSASSATFTPKMESDLTWPRFMTSRTCLFQRAKKICRDSSVKNHNH